MKNKLTKQEIEEIATKLTNIDPIKDREYQVLRYEITNKHHNCRYEQIRKEIFKSKKRIL